MTDTTTLPAGIETLAYACWHPVWPDGQPSDLDGDRVPHFRSEAGAHASIARTGPVAGRGQPSPAQLDVPCVQAAAACGFLYDEEGDGVEHFESPQDALITVLDAGWTVRADGTLRCSADCDNGCNDEAARP